MSCELRCFVCLNYFLVTQFWGCLFFLFMTDLRNTIHLWCKTTMRTFGSAVGSLIFFCLPAIRSLPGEWVVRLESQLAKSLFPPPQKQKPHEIKIFTPTKQSVSLFHSLSQALCVCLSSLSRLISIFTLNVSISLSLYAKSMGIPAYIHEVSRMTLFPQKHNPFPFAHILCFYVEREINIFVIICS